MGEISTSLFPVDVQLCQQVALRHGGAPSALLRKMLVPLTAISPNFPINMQAQISQAHVTPPSTSVYLIEINDVACRKFSMSSPTLP